jgi:putative spermidine/putrescine transport system permease protein
LSSSVVVAQPKPDGKRRLSALQVAARRGLLRPSVSWLALPGMAFLAFFFLYPVLQLLAVSFQDPETAAFSLAGYHRVIVTKVYLHVLENTFVIATQTTGCCQLLG